MQFTNQRSYVYYTATALLLAGVYFIQSSTSLLPRIAAVSAMPALTLMLCVAIFSDEIAGALTGLLLGIAMDIVSPVADGFNAIALMLLGLAVSLLATYLFNDRLVSAMVLCSVFTALYYLIYWVFFIRGYSGAWMYLLRYSLPGAVYTWVFVFPFWAIMHRMSHPHRKKSKNSLLE